MIYMDHANPKILFVDKLDIQSWKLKVSSQMHKKNFDLFLSPSVYNNFLKAKQNFKFIPHKEDLFAFGLCFLNIIGGFDTSELYQDFGFDEELLEEYKKEFTSNF